MAHESTPLITNVLLWGKKTAFSPVNIRDGHDNFFTPLRLLMALLVVFGHTFIIANRDLQGEPNVFFHYCFSYLAVNLFFIASGFLVTKSMTYRGSLSEFVSARVLRIYPALIVHILFVMLIIGPLATTLPLWDYLSSADVWKQPLLVLPFINTDVLLPGVFLDNHEPFASGPLWTLRYEVLAYIATAMVFSFGFMKRKWMILAQFILPSCAWLIAHKTGIYDSLPGTFQNMMRFGIAYGLGAAIYAYKDRLTFNLFGLVAVVVAAIILGHTHFIEISMNFLLAYSLMFLAYVKVPALNPLRNISDTSYGIYIYHWCVLQIVFAWWPNLGAWSLLAIGIPVTCLLAYLSWHIVEKPCLKAKKGIAKTLKFGRAPKTFSANSVLQD